MSDEKVYWHGEKPIVSVDVASGSDYTTIYSTADGIHFTELGTFPGVPVAPPIVKDGPFSGKNRPRTRNDLLERLMKYDWGQQLDILQYMKRFDTWDALYADLDRRAADSEQGIRNVTPEKPKQLRENNG
jgi:hypothetical protein